MDPFSFGVPHLVAVAFVVLCVANEHTLDATIGDFRGSLRLRLDSTSFPPSAQAMREFGVLTAKMLVARSGQSVSVRRVFERFRE
jgi:hypothetical protein